MDSVLIKILKTDDEICKTVTSGKGQEYANMDLITFKPGTISELNRLLARRATLLELYNEESKNP